VVYFNVLKLYGLVDLTSLNDTDTAETISALCQKATMANHHVAAVCVFPAFVKTAKEALADQSVRIATVANFPQGTDTLDSVLALIRRIIVDGADEVDVVFPYRDYLKGEKEKAYDFIRACKAACGDNVLLKVILETGALQDASVIEEVSYNVCHAGADFLKTSTGKIAVGATPEAARAMLTVIKKIPRAIGFKVSGGVRTIEQAEEYIKLAEDIMGSGWVSPAHFRIGASQLVDVLRSRVD
jgi:deoxyribose-phosphate aldolase